MPRRRATGPLNRPDREEVGTANQSGAEFQNQRCAEWQRFAQSETLPGCLTIESETNSPVIPGHARSA
jgi:hypothetical protein